MKASRLAPLLACSLFIASSAAFADEGEFHCPALGTQIATSIRGHLTSEGAEGFNCRMRTSSRLVAPHAVFADTGAGPAWREAAERLWPLAIGKESEYVSVCDGRECPHGLSYHHKLTVVAVEDVTVKAGTFKAYKVTADNTSGVLASKMDIYHSRASYWWAPAVGYTVKFEWQVLSGSAYKQDASWEAVSVVSGPILAK